MTKIKAIVALLCAFGFSGIASASASEYITVVMEGGQLVQVNVALVKGCNSAASGRSSNRSNSWSFKYYSNIEKIVYQDATTIIVINGDGRLCFVSPNSLSSLNNFEAPGVQMFNIDIDENKVKDASFYRAK